MVVKQAGNGQRQHLWQNSRPKRSYPSKLPMLMDEGIQRFRERSLKRYKNMLVYLESSPDYCNADPGIVGVYADKQFERVFLIEFEWLWLQIFSTSLGAKEAIDYGFTSV
ncbi:unnamed protein product [Dibothriocephalus latus]|uniref:Uncharacterized protein n=1 Tax=Dibothriocephalus latus TaxID=60516 RepID=A0A3P7RF15_DIBLA|nr:unnamed protein product [Dibothriocephalus latus]